MAKELIKGGNNETLGYLIDQGNRKEIHDPAGKLLGYYKESQNKTFLPSGTFVGYGEQLMRLLEK